MSRWSSLAISVERLRLTADGLYTSEAIALRDKAPQAIEVIDPLPLTVSWQSLDRGL